MIKSAHIYLQIMYCIHSSQVLGLTFSTETCLTHLTDMIRFNIDKGLFTGMVLIDLQEAFGTIDYGILLKKLKVIGLQNDVLTWFKSYLNDRKHFVDVGDTRSEFCDIKCGVSQRSILGSLLFLLYVNDMSNDLFLHADDTTLLASGKTVSEIEINLQNNLIFRSA